MKKRYTVFANKRSRAIRASMDYATLRGMDFKKAKDILTKDGFYEHEYGDKDNNNGYAVYRKGNKEVELQYRWVAGKRNGDAHAGKVTNVYVDEDINGACGKKPVKASNEGRSDLIYVIMVNGNPVAKGSYDAMVKKSYTYNYPVQMLKFPKAKLNSLIKMAKDAHRPDPLKFAVNRFINDNTSEYDSLNASTSRSAIKVSGGQIIFPFLVEGEFADGYTCKVSGNSEAECVETLADMQDKHGELVWYSGVTDEDYEFGKSVYSSSNVRRVTASVDDAEVDLTFIGEPSAIMDLKNAALSAGDTITRFNANTLIIHTWDYAVDEYMEYANDLGLSVDDVNYVKSAKKITCSYDADDIVMYFNGKKVFTGKWYDIVDTIEDLCKDPDVNSAFQDWCMQYNLGNGNYDVVFDGTPRDTAAVFWSLIDNVYEESDYSDFYVDGDGILDFEIFYADQEVGVPE